MDIYQIIITHNRSWTIREIIAFAVVFLMAVFLAAVLLRLHKIVIIQAVCGLLLLTFFAIVFGSTVFTRTPGIRQSGHGRKSWGLVHVADWEVLREMAYCRRIC